MSLYELYLYLVFIVKLSVLFFFIQNRFFHTEETEKHLLFTENIFNALMSFLIIYLFIPFSSNPIFIDRETKLFLFIFALLTLLHIFS